MYSVTGVDYSLTSCFQIPKWDRIGELFRSCMEQETLVKVMGALGVSGILFGLGVATYGIYSENYVLLPASLIPIIPGSVNAVISYLEWRKITKQI